MINCVLVISTVLLLEFKVIRTTDVYIGCFKDDPERMHDYPDLQGWRQSDMRNSKCFNFCKNFIYRGLQFSEFCFCGNDYPEKHRYPKVEDNECSMTCAGERSVKCGDSYRTSLYKDCNILQKPPHCSEIDCESRSNISCTKCDSTFLYKVNAAKRCEEICSWDDRWCWPGRCSDGFAKNCNCMSGFKTIKNSNAASCQPSTEPSISSCRLTALGNNSSEASSNKVSLECSLQQDMYGRFQVKSFVLDINAFFHVQIDTALKPLPAFVENYQFGITDVYLEVIKISVKGFRTNTKTIPVASDKTPVEVFDQKIRIIVNEELIDGDKICVITTVKAGGYLVSKNIITQDTKKIDYNKTQNSRDICYIYDKSSPTHCLDKSKCKSEPLLLSSRLTNTRKINVYFDDWFDPYPNGNQSLASGILSYEINIFEVKDSTPAEQMRDTTTLTKYTLANNETEKEVELPAKNPMLYAILLEVTDVANNAKSARRFVLFDNSSVIRQNEEEPLRAQSALPETGYTWQTKHNNLCFSWTNRFYNDKYLTNNPLRPIKSEYFVEEKYDQISGLLPINGTDNVNGITQFYYSLSKNNTDFVADGEIVNVTYQSICLDVKPEDGDSFTFTIQARDIMNHTLNDSVSVNIDRSVPEIIDIWLLRNNQTQLFVHHSSDLSVMLFQFKAFDPHSGLREVKWAFGTYENNTVLIDGGIGVVTKDKSDNCLNISDCYCPMVGNCSIITYTANLTKLHTANKHIGNHNRRYFFTVNATNNAYLLAVAQIDILVDESEPEVGVVLEGPVGSRDIDYTSSDEVIVHWHGFIDHESGIKFYRVSLGRRCFNLTDIRPGEHRGSVIQDTPYESIKFVFPDGEGKYFVSIIAFNHAMSPSKLVCSDGVTLDKSVPKINSVSVKHAQTVESVACYEEQPWLIRIDISKVKLLDEACINMCYNEANNELVSLLPEVLKNNSDISSFLCATTKRYQNNFIYAPSDLFDISWSIEDDHSQIAEVSLGFGRDITNVDAPDIMGYLNLPNKTKYVQRHPGLIGERKVYIFIKVKNRAGLEHKVWYGPILADESPPICSSDIQPLVDGEYLVVNWTNSMLHDNDQQEEIGKLMFRIGIDDRFVTPYLEWNIITHGGQCGTNHQCIRYPVRRLQKYDSEIGSLFFIQLHAYNYAGHFCSVSTKPFSLPSIFPPRDGIVIDLLPDSIPPYQDTDVIFDSRMFCFAWTGFNHHENVALQASLGTKPKTDNIKTFHDIAPTATGIIICEKLQNDLEANQQYFVTVKASCSGDIIYASSDGFIKISSETVRSSINVYIGQRCDAHNRITITQIQKKQEYNIVFLNLLEYLIPGRKYSISISKNKENIKLNDKNMHIIASYFIDNKTILTFIPLDYINQIMLNISDNEGNITEDRISVHQCDVSRPLQSSSTMVPVHWSAFVQYGSLITHYEAAICQIFTAKRDCHNQLIFKNVGNNTATSFHDRFMEGFYKAAVKACFGNRCLQPAWSSEVGIQTHLPKLPDVKVTGTVHDTCLNILVVFEKVSCTLENNAKSANDYRWAIFDDENQRNMLSRWKVVVHKLENTDVKDSACIDIPVYPHKPLYVCVESFCINGVTDQTCSVIEVKNDPNIFDKNVLYDLNLRNPLIRYVYKYEHSNNIGESLAVLHDIEIDFSRNDVEIGAFLLGQSHGIIQWFLMTIQKTPQGPCSLDSMCLMSKNTTSGLVQFGNVHLKEGGLFYICATKIEQNTNSTKCSDGFLVDNSVPKGGVVSIESNSGYIVDGSEMILKWSGFYGTSKATTLGYPSDIALYEYAIGTHLGFGDVVHFKSAGIAQSKIIQNLRLVPGQAYFAAVRAFNQVNNSVTVYSEPVIFDNTPPSIGKIYVHEIAKGFVKTHQIIIEWSDIHDKESGVHKFEIGIGESNDSADIVQFTDVDDSVEINVDGLFKDGHRYYAMLKATNGAGLESCTLSYPFVVDGSPPDIGHVIDVLSPGTITENDIDYQTETKYISCRWYGFHDTHSYIVNYKVALGTSPGDDNVMMLTDVGLRTFKTWSSSFQQGVKYYSTVEACNGAGLCSRVTSNGITIDKSPPVPGVVVVGDPGSHSKYLPDRKTLNFAWIGFDDPQSEINHFEACVGTSKRMCDVVDWWNTSLSSTCLRSGLNMTVGLRMFVTVRACNKVAMCTKRSSPGFVIDDTPPVSKSKPCVVALYGISSSRKIMTDPSFLKLAWQFEDDRSPVTRTIISMQSNLDAHVPLPDTVLTNENQYVTNLTKENILRLGDTYKVKVTACNAASLCTTALSDEILVDYTPPPHIGGFLPSLEYEVYNPSSRMILLHLYWYGFVDLESDIQSYFISVGQSYSGTEFVENYKIAANNTDDKNTKVAHIVFEVPKTLPDNLVLTLSAENYAGIITKEVKVTTYLVSSNTNHSHGRLLIQTHSCNVSYCNNDCTCSVRGKKYKANKIVDCHSSSAADSILINVTLITNSPSTVGSAKCLQSNWVVHSDNSTILRYEYSFGLRGSQPGNGIFDLSAVDPWTDVGQQTKAFYCLPNGQELDHGGHYVAYVRAWVSFSEFALFASTPGVIDHTPPSIKKKQFAVDSSPLCDGDVDYILSNEVIGVCWNGVFTDEESTITTYQILLGTSPSLDDTVSVTDVGNKTYFQWTGLPIEPGTRYFATVRAINSIGYQTEVSSDGFVIDDTPPTAGVVYNTGDHHDAIYHSTEEDIQFSWSGFDDEHSFIDYYLVAYLVNNNSAESLSFINYGLSDIFTYKGKISNNATIVALVKARDKTGHESTVVESPVLHIDRTPPNFFVCDTFLQNQQLDIVVKEENYIWSQLFSSNRHNVFNIHIKVRRVRLDFRAYLTIDDMSMILPFAVNADDSIVSEYTYLSDKQKLINISVQVSGVIPSSLLSIKVSKCEHLTIRNNTGEEIMLQQISHGAVSVCIRALDMESGIKQISIGTGSVLDGLEINELRFISTHLHHIIQGNFTHGMVIYVKAIVQNHAGLKSIFNAKPLKIDHTPPIMQNVRSSVEYFPAVNDTSISVKSTWIPYDEDSDIRYCEYCIGVSRTSCGVIAWTRSESRYSFHSTTIYIEHGTKLFGQVRCINFVELVGNVHFGPLMISYLQPINVNSHVEFIAFTEISPTVQSDTGSITVRWNEFEDISKVKDYSAQMTHKGYNAGSWQNIGNKNYLTFTGLYMQSGGMYDVKIKGRNIGGIESIPINKSITVNSFTPILTGNQISVQQISDNGFLIKWSDIFSSVARIESFSVSIGSLEGSSDVLMPTSTTMTEMPIDIPDYVKQLYCVVMATTNTGLSEFYRQAVIIP